MQTVFTVTARADGCVGCTGVLSRRVPTGIAVARMLQPDRLAAAVSPNDVLACWLWFVQVSERVSVRGGGSASCEFTKQGEVAGERRVSRPAPAVIPRAIATTVVRWHLASKYAS